MSGARLVRPRRTSLHAGIHFWLNGIHRSGEINLEFDTWCCIEAYPLRGVVHGIQRTPGEKAMVEKHYYKRNNITGCTDVCGGGAIDSWCAIMRVLL